MSDPRSAAWYRNTYTDVSTSGIIAAATAGATDVPATPSVKHTIFVQKVVITMKTAHATAIIVQDDAGTPVHVLTIEASAAAGTIRSIDFGAEGFALTEGKNLDFSHTAGPAYSYSVEAYAKQTAAGQAHSTARIF